MRRIGNEIGHEESERSIMSKAYIWDLDGTLVNSYAKIVPAVRGHLMELGVDYSEEYIREIALKSSVGKLLDQVGPMIGKDPELLKEEFEVRNDREIVGIEPMPHAKEVLKRLTRRGDLCFIYTHRGASCYTIVDETGLRPYFTEIVTSLEGFPRKPAPEGILYLVEKYKLDPENTYYVGDRPIDIRSGSNAGIRTILYLPEGSPVEPVGVESFVIHDLEEI